MKLPEHAAYCDDAGGLFRIYEPGINLVIWRRKTPSAVLRYLRELPDTCLFEAWGYCEEANLRSMVEELLLQEKCLRNFPGGRIELRDDIISQARVFFEVSRAEHVEIQFERLITARAPGFHTDGPDLRLFHTYRTNGKVPGTVWLPNALVDRKAMICSSTAYSSFSEHNDRVRIGPPSGELSINAGETTISKSDTYIDNMNRGWVHRGPDITGTGVVRTVLAINSYGGWAGIPAPIVRSHRRRN